jgi:tetratricopeptide (TPR) repeat protein
LLGVGLLAGEPELAFDQANRLYEQGKFAEAAAAYERLAQSGNVSAALYFNRGNAWFKSGRLGKAIASYRQAEQLAPRDPDIRANLQFARSSVGGAIRKATPAWRRWSTRLNLNEWTALTAAGFWACLALLTVEQFYRGRKLQLRRYAFLAGIVTLGCGGGAFLNWEERFSTLSAVVAERDTQMRHGPLDESPTLQTLADGLELDVIDQKDDWVKVAGASRGLGWVKRSQVILLGRQSKGKPSGP